MTMETSIAFVGLGSMGCGMATNLVKCGFKVRGYDINELAAKRLVTAGGKRASTPKAAVEEGHANVLICMVATEQQASSCLFDTETGAAACLAVNGAILLCLTASPEFARNIRSSLDDQHREDITLLDCPVSGGADRASDGTLSILYSGAGQLPKNVGDVLKTLGSRLNPAGFQVGNASALKMVHQILVGVHIVAAAEVIGLATVAGLDIQALYREIMDGESASWLFGQRVPHMMALDKPPFSSLGIILKDLNMVNACGRARRFPLILSSTAAQIFSSTIGAGLGYEDDCAPLRLYLLGRDGLSAETRKVTDAKEAQKSESASGITISTVRNILRAIHLAAAAEAISFAQELELNLQVFHDFVKDAAGASVMFQEYSSRFLQTGLPMTLNLIDGNYDIAVELVSKLDNNEDYMK
ncbi:hypothetical protein H2200_012926 [Cladophialophora chaetospira]|uniref:3-hydroxyisobutyrate dehydrogenase n=1 Tax=Cladophialophora chaetospira TaxID=386627 RepID=A0AA38WX70_9EURO|nr:hypothetical protein H2200_012926 [Cladophialophora chaetospira]